MVRVKQVMVHSKFMDGVSEQVDKYLEGQAAVEPRKAHWCFELVRDESQHPGGAAFRLAWKRRIIHRELFFCIPDGFYFRHKVLRDLSLVERAFKEHPMPPTAQ